MKFTLSDSKRSLNDEENKFFLEVFNKWKSIQHTTFLEWNSTIDEFCKQNGVLVKFDETVPKECNQNELHLYLAEQDKGNKAACFFRHFRNAFDHDHIYRSIGGDDEMIAHDMTIAKKKKDDMGNQGQSIVYRMCCRCSFDFFKDLTFQLLEVGENAYNKIVEDNCKLR